MILDCLVVQQLPCDGRAAVPHSNDRFEGFHVDQAEVGAAAFDNGEVNASRLQWMCACA